MGSFLPVNFGSWEICKATSIQGANISPVILKDINLSLISRNKNYFRKHFTCTFQLIAFVCFISIYVHSDSSSRTTYFQKEMWNHFHEILKKIFLLVLLKIPVPDSLMTILEPSWKKIRMPWFFVTLLSIGSVYSKLSALDTVKLFPLEDVKIFPKIGPNIILFHSIIILHYISIILKSPGKKLTNIFRIVNKTL